MAVTGLQPEVIRCNFAFLSGLIYASEWALRKILNVSKYQLDDVVEVEAPLQNEALKSQGGLRVAAVSDDSGTSILKAALAFVPKTESLYQEWSETVFSGCVEKHQHFKELAFTQPTRADWSTVYSGVQLALLMGDTEQSRLDTMDAWLAVCNDKNAGALRSTLAFFGHQPKLAVDLYEQAYGLADGAESAPEVQQGLSAVVYVLSLIQQTTQSMASNSAGEFSESDCARLIKLITKLNTFAGLYQRQFQGDVFLPVLHVLTDFVRVVAKTREIKDTFWLGGVHIDASPWLDLFLNLIHHWLGDKPEESQVARLADHVDAASVAGLHWFVDEGLTLLSACGLQRENCEFQPQMRSTGWLLTVYKPQADWRAGLDALSLTVNRHARVAGMGAKTDNRRLTWWVSAEGSRILVEPREQRLQRNKTWDHGKHFPLKLLLDECGTLDFLCDFDLKICTHLRNQLQLNHALHFEKTFTFSDAESLQLILNHPRLYRFLPDDEENDLEELPEPVRITMVECQSTLQVVADHSMQEINISMEPYPSTAIKSSSDFLCEWQHDNVLAISSYTEGQLDIARALSYNGLSVPDDAAENLLESLREMAALVEIHSDINSIDSNTVVASRRLAFHLRPLDKGLDITAYIYPLGEAGPCVTPGLGRPSLYAMVGNQPCNTTRDLSAERHDSKELLSTLPLPELSASDTDKWQWLVSEAEPALEVLAALQGLENKVVLMWPAGESILLSQVIDSDNMHIHFNSNLNGIGVAGELKLEEGDQNLASGSYHAGSEQCAFASKKIDLKKLLASLDVAEGRFLRLDDGKILQLSYRLRMQLDALNALSDEGTAHHLTVPVLAEVSRGMVLREDASWDEQLDKLREAEALMVNTPVELQAELRDYQLEGFRWMTRLAHWGAGACLADDMGLGKTMQSLSLMLMRAVDGPALVIAPTSVCGNWLAEAEKFAPGLNLHWLGDGNRKQKLDGAKPYDLFVCSYGVLQNEIELLQEIQWNTIVADEAQSFKNPATRRSQAMMSLQGNFRMAATGTPIENHLGELWNLFRFINPGLLGSARKFKDRYAHPIEHNDDDMARQRLKTLIKPFILRRLKREVLTELPPRTEITHMVEFNDEEKSFYDSLRLSALQRISELTDLDHEQRFRVLAEITVLRQACCHPKLVEENPPCGSAKLRAFAQIVDELRHNGHRCLVFSQFVGHLSLIRNHLDSNNISYQYLDGSTSVKNRKKAVDDFQAGAGELFLISLKAGGSGLNLTEADYVIHMDPWWNPAVEDQASDRAYRMGQKRPVTIYRMVVKDTIEEKIVKLHEQKRDLANALLEGTDGGSRLSVDELIGLIDDESAEDESES